LLASDGKELFYLGPNNTLMAVDVNGPDRTSRSVVRSRSSDCESDRVLYVNALRLSSDGQRFVMITRDVGQTSTINVVLNWDAELRSK